MDPILPSASAVNQAAASAAGINTFSIVDAPTLVSPADISSSTTGKTVSKRKFDEELTTDSPKEERGKVSRVVDKIELVDDVVDEEALLNDLIEPKPSETSEERSFYFNGKLIEGDKYFYVSPTKWSESKILSAIAGGRMGILYGPSQSGKTTRVADLIGILRTKGYYPIYVPAPPMEEHVDKWWNDFCCKVASGVQIPGLNLNSRETFLAWFCTLEKPVLFLDEADKLQYCPLVMESFLSSMKELRDGSNYKSVWLVGRYLTTTLHAGTMSPFNISTSLAAPFFTRIEVFELFSQYTAQMRRRYPDFKLPREILEDIYYQTNGHQGLTNLCGVILTGIVKNGKSPSYEDWLDANDTSAVWEAYSRSANGMRIVSELSSMSRLSFASRLLGHPKGIALARDDEEIAHQLAQHGIILLSVIESPGLVAKFLCPAVACLVRQQVNIRRLPLQLPQGFVATDVPALLELVLPHVNREKFVNSVMQKALNRTPGSKKMPLEALYGHELHRVISLLFTKSNLQVFPQLPVKDDGGGTKWADLVISSASGNDKFRARVVLELGVNLQLRSPAGKPPTHTLRYHLEKSAMYAHELQVPAWVVHFTNGTLLGNPIDTAADGSNVHVLHVMHDEGFTKATFVCNNNSSASFSLLPPLLPRFDLESFLRDEAKIKAANVEKYLPLLRKNEVDEAGLRELAQDSKHDIEARLEKWGISADGDRLKLAGAITRHFK